MLLIVVSSYAPGRAILRPPLAWSLLSLTLRGCTHVGLPVCLCHHVHVRASPRYCLPGPASASATRSTELSSPCKSWRYGRTSLCQTHTRTWSLHPSRCRPLPFSDRATPRSLSHHLEWRRTGQAALRQNPQSWPHPYSCARLEVELESSFVPSLLLLQPYDVGASIGVFPPLLTPLSPNAVVHQISLA